MSHFDEALVHVVSLEGGYSNDPADSGGETNRGITVAVARAAGYAGKMIDMTPLDARDIYRKRYWNALNLDTISALDFSLALKLFDAGVNVGVKKAGEWVQRALNVLNNEGVYWPDVTVDGVLGSNTIAALNALHARRGSDGMAVLRRGVNCLQGSFYITLAEGRKKDERFVYGWLKQRVL